MKGKNYRRFFRGGEHLPVGQDCQSAVKGGKKTEGRTTLESAKTDTRYVKNTGELTSEKRLLMGEIVQHARMHLRTGG